MSQCRASIHPARVLFPLDLGTALSLVGDTTLYAALPTHTAAAGVALSGVGILLSANRAVRVLLNGPAGLAARIEMPPHAWTTEGLWRAYAHLERDRVRGVGARRTLTDLVSLVRHAVQLEDELIPYPDQVRRRYREWLAAQEAAGRAITAEQRWWLDRIAETVGVNLSVTSDDFQVGELFERGGWIAARRLFGADLPVLLEELNEALVV